MKNSYKITFVLGLLLVLVACGGAEESPAEQTNNETAVEPLSTTSSVEEMEAHDMTVDATSSDGASAQFQIEAWADNWFAAYSGETLIVEDSVSITTERSFNEETATFEASYPVQLNFMLKDFKENDTGLEYIGERNQQMGDGGFIMQLTDLDRNEVVAVSDDSFQCLVIHEAPLDKSCEREDNPVAGEGVCGFTSSDEPANWKQPNFDDSDWFSAIVYSKSDVSPKDGYDRINWDSDAQLIWGPDLETNNTVLCRLTVHAP